MVDLSTKRWQIGVVLVALAALILAAEAAEPSRASRALLPIARVSDSVTLVQGPRRVAFVVGDDGWFTIDERGFTNAADVARSLYAHAGALEGDLKTMLWARTPAVAVGEKVARAGAKKPIKAPGVIESVIALGSDKELWHYSSGFSGRVAIVDAKDRVKAVAPLASIGKGVPGAIPGVCGAPSAWRAARTADGVAVIHMECHVETPLRLQLIKSDGTSTVRSLQSTSAAGRFEPRQFAVAKDGTPVLAGVLSSSSSSRAPPSTEHGRSRRPRFPASKRPRSP